MTSNIHFYINLCSWLTVYFKFETTDILLSIFPLPSVDPVWKVQDLLRPKLGETARIFILPLSWSLVQNVVLEAWFFSEKMVDLSPKQLVECWARGVRLSSFEIICIMNRHYWVYCLPFTFFTCKFFLGKFSTEYCETSESWQKFLADRFIPLSRRCVLLCLAPP